MHILLKGEEQEPVERTGVGLHRVGGDREHVARREAPGSRRPGGPPAR
jgi:hypothetical protein